MTYRQKSGNKYHAVSTMYEGVAYHSKLEAAYAEELTLREKAKDIVSWERQVKLDLKVNEIHITNYYIDFIIHHNDGHREFVEIKGMVTALWRLKWLLLEATFDDFKEQPDDCMTVIKQSSIRNYR